MPPTLDDLKAHLRLDGTADDALLSVYAAAAWDYVRAFTRTDWPDPSTVPASATVAVMLLVGDMYENREAQTAAPLRENETVNRLLWPHRVF